jgi:hypothetical protein
LIADIDEYEEEIKDGEIAFNLTRTGTGTSTAYSLKPLTAKKFKAIEEKFKAFEGEKVLLEFFEERLVPKTEDYMVKLLHEAGFPVEQHFSAELVAKVLGNKGAEEENIEPVSETNEDVI